MNHLREVPCFLDSPSMLDGIDLETPPDKKHHVFLFSRSSRELDFCPNTEGFCNITSKRVLVFAPLSQWYLWVQTSPCHTLVASISVRTCKARPLVSCCFRAAFLKSSRMAYDTLWQIGHHLGRNRQVLVTIHAHRIVLLSRATSARWPLDNAAHDWSVIIPIPPWLCRRWSPFENASRKEAWNGSGVPIIEEETGRERGDTLRWRADSRRYALGHS